MINNFTWTRWYSLGLIFCLALAVGCQGQKTPEELESGAQALYDEAEGLWKINEEKKALTVYDQIAKEYPGTEVAKKLEKELALRNIYFGSAANSWTNLRMYEAENLLVEIHKETGEYPSAFDAGADAWDTLIKYKLFDAKKVDFDFMIISAGQDKKFDTGDDLRLVHAKNTALSPSAGNSATARKDATGDDDLSSLEGLEESASRLKEAGDGQEDQEVSLKDLSETMKGQKKTTEKSKNADGVVDLKDLMEGKF